LLGSSTQSLGCLCQARASRFLPIVGRESRLDFLPRGLCSGFGSAHKHARILIPSGRFASDFLFQSLNFFPQTRLDSIPRLRLLKTVTLRIWHQAKIRYVNLAKDPHCQVLRLEQFSNQFGTTDGDVVHPDP